MEVRCTDNRQNPLSWGKNNGSWRDWANRAREACGYQAIQVLGSRLKVTCAPINWVTRYIRFNLMLV